MFYRKILLSIIVFVLLFPVSAKAASYNLACYRDMKTTQCLNKQFVIEQYGKSYDTWSCDPGWQSECNNKIPVENLAMTSNKYVWMKCKSTVDFLCLNNDQITNENCDTGNQFSFPDTVGECLSYLVDFKLKKTNPEAYAAQQEEKAGESASKAAEELLYVYCPCEDGCWDEKLEKATDPKKMEYTKKCNSECSKVLKVGHCPKADNGETCGFKCKCSDGKYQEVEGRWEGLKCPEKCPAVQICDGKETDYVSGVDSLKTQAKKNLNPLFGKLSLGVTGVNQLIGKIISFIMFAVGAIAMLMYILAGALWMTAAGNSERVEKAKTIAVWTSLGLVIMLSAYVIAKFVLNILAGKG